MDYSITELCRFFEDARQRSESLVLATVLRTEASTYRKAGARMLIAPDGRASGILSGGCLEADLAARAARVLDRGRPERIWFDTRDSEDAVWGLGMGCQGAMDIWLQPELPQAGYPVMTYLRRCLETGTPGALAQIVGGDAAPHELGRTVFAAADAAAAPDALAAAANPHASTRPALRRVSVGGRNLEVFSAPIELPPSILLCGAGPDAVPVHEFAVRLGWRVSIYDHRPAFAQAAHFPGARAVICARAEKLCEHVDPAQFDAAIVMSHHLAADRAYLEALVAAAPRFIGLLGPAHRRARLLAEVGEAVHAVAGRIHGPVGLDIGATTPQGIALAIIAQVHAVLSGRSGGPFAPASTPPR
jgi:xanthine/CO dehydrogenase XdhC/CoxF family maturation factor